MTSLSRPFDASASACERPAVPAPGGSAAARFDALYEETVAYVWRAARRLGVDAADADDVVQEVFVIVHRRLPELDGRASTKPWILQVVLHVVRHYLRTRRRKPGHRVGTTPDELEALPDQNAPSPGDALERAEAARILDALLDKLDRHKREVFVLSEIEQMTVVEIAEAIQTNLNTVYSRLRAARRAFERALARFRAREAGRRP